MAGPGAQGMFRRASLEHLSSPERVDELMRVTRPYSWIALATLAALLGGAVAWGIVGRISVTVSGRGIVATPAQLERVPSFAASAPDSGLVSLSCFSVRDGARLRTGMRLTVAPDSVPRERYGALVAELVAVTAAPVPQRVVEAALDNPQLAARLVPPEGCLLALGLLKADSSSPSGYQWSASRGPPTTLMAGTPAMARVVVERRSPISYVLPVLRTMSDGD